MSVNFPGEGRCSLIMSAVTKPELYFQPEIKQKEKLWRGQIQSLPPGLLLSLPKAEK